MVQKWIYEVLRILFVHKENKNNHSCLPCQSPLHIHKSITTHVCDAAVDAVFGWTIPLNVFQCTGQAFMSASVYLQRACFRPKHDIIKTWTESLMLMLFTESTWNCLLVLNRDLSTVFFFWESGSLAESPFAPFWSSCSPKDPYGFTNAEHSWSWTKWTRVPTRSKAGYISLTVVSVCHGSNVSLNRGEAWAKCLNIKKKWCLHGYNFCLHL